MEAGRGRLCKAARRAWSVAARSGHCRASRGRRTASPPHSCPEQAVRALDAVRSAVSAARARGQPARVNETSYDQCPTRPTTVTQRFPKPSTRILGHSGVAPRPDDLQLAVLDDERHSTDRPLREHRPGRRTRARGHRGCRDGPGPRRCRHLGRLGGRALQPSGRPRHRRVGPDELRRRCGGVRQRPHRLVGGRARRADARRPQPRR